MRDDSIESSDADIVAAYGGKGANLMRLKAAGFDVPDFFVLPVSAFEEFVSDNFTAVGSVAIGRRDIKEALPKMRFRAEAAERILSEYDRAFGGGKVAIRSSAVNEDGSSASMAGEYRTVLSVERESLLEAVKEVYASALFHTDERLADALMAVVVQRQIEPHKAGVAFADSNRVVINAIIGQGERVVSGKESGDAYLIENDGIRKSIKRQHKMSSDGTNISDVPLQVAASQKLMEYEIKEISDMAKRVQKTFGAPQDIEWCIDSGGLLLLQARPITRSVDVPSFERKDGLMPICAGIAEGAPWTDAKVTPDTDVILVGTYFEQRDIARLLGSGRVKGMITQIGGILSHEGILARERGIPYLAGVSNPEELVKSAKTVVLDTANVRVIADGRDVLDQRGDTYTWLDRDIGGLRSIRFAGGGEYGVVARLMGGFAVVYSNVRSRSAYDKILRALSMQNVSAVVCNVEDRTLEVAYKNSINIINSDAGLRSSVSSMTDAVRRFDADAFTAAFLLAKDAAKREFEGARLSFQAYESRPSPDMLRAAFKVFARANSFYKGVCLMGNYFEYALGVSASEKAGRVVSDVEIHRFRSEYERSCPEIKRTEEAVGQAIAELDGSLPTFGDGASSLEGLYSMLMDAAKGVLGAEEVSSLLCGIEYEPLQNDAHL
ncbi:MAG: hypothetical protein KGH60_00555 [Candidatus Micrarchaeota archaeon]|nr:hypothetical protein [Candidatus Micrarchaeota archaeon]